MSKSSDSAESRRPAKLNPPRPPISVFRRNRLYRQVKWVLEAGAALWVQGPAGAGKTTLIASYLETEQCPSAWYRLDAEDAEPAVFFRHMRLTSDATQAGTRLPSYDPRVGQDPVRFASTFFRAYFEAMPAGTAVVLDDYHEVEPDGVLDAILATALAELPRDRHLVIISRAAAPKALARLLAEGRLQCLGWEALRLSDDEARQIARLRLPPAQRTELAIEDINRRVQGWVAGLVLLLQQGAPADLTTAPTPETVNEYFATQLFSRQRGDEFDVLAALSLFADFTPAMAEAMTGDPQMPMRVEELYRRNFFLTRHQGEADTLSYRFHPLFQNYLRRELAARLSVEERAELLLRAANILSGQGAVAEAVRLYQAAEAWPQAEALLVTEAPHMYRNGDFGLLRQALGRMPAARLERNAWLLMWRGAAAAAKAASLGREDLEHAYTLFRDTHDLIGALTAWCTLVEGYVFEWGDFHPLDRWIDVFDELEPALMHAPLPLVHRATVAMFGALFNRRPFGAQVAEWARRTEEVFLDTVDPVTRALVVSNLSFYNGFTRGRMSRASAFLNDIKTSEGQGFDNPIADIVFLGHFAVVNMWSTGNVEASLEAVRKGIDRVKDTGVHMMDFLLYADGAWASIIAGDYARADWFIDGLTRVFNHDSLLNRCVYHDTKAIVNIHRGNVELARAESEISLELARRGGMPFAECACLLTASRVRSAAGEWADAEHFRQRAAEIATAMDNQLMLNHLVWFEAADLLQRHGESAVLEPLRRALSGGRVGNVFANLWVEHGRFARLCHIALVHDIEPDYVRRLVGNLGMRAPELEWGRDGWPFPLRIELLSGLRVTVLRNGDYQPVTLQGRSGQLLEALVWLGGRKVSQEQLADILWPDAEGDAARRNFDTTLHRLRRSLGDERLLTLDGGRLSLAQGITWSDIGSLALTRRVLQRAQQAADDGGVARAQAQLIEEAAVLVQGASAGGPFAAYGAALRREMEQSFGRAGIYWQDRSAWPEAVQALEAQLRLNPLAETAYVQLMRIYLAQEMPAAALMVYQRCAKNLNQILGVAPGAEIETLRRELS